MAKPARSKGLALTAHIRTYALPTGTYSTGWYEAVGPRFVIPDDDCRVRVRHHASSGKSPSGGFSQQGLSQHLEGVGRMRSSRTAMQSRHSEGDQHPNIVEFALMIALVAVLLSASVLLLVAQLSGQ
jgi:hypothetical protein